MPQTKTRRQTIVVLQTAHDKLVKIHADQQLFQEVENTISWLIIEQGIKTLANTIKSLKESTKDPA